MSKRDMLARKMAAMKNPEARSEESTIVDELLSDFEKGESKSIEEKDNTPVIQNTPAKSQDLPPRNDFINVIDKSHVGRPKTLVGTYKAISARLKMENYVFARKEGAMYGGMNAYINYLIEKDLKRKSKNR